MIEYKNRLGGSKIILVSPDGSINIIQNGKQTELSVNKENISDIEVSGSSELSPTTYNDLGLLTEDVTIQYPTTEPGTVQHYQGQFQVDVNGNYSVDFGTVIMTGDTELHNYSTYVFDIIGDHGTLTEYRFGGFFGKVISGFSGSNVVVSINNTDENIPVNENGWFFKLVDTNTTSIIFNTADKSNFERLYLSGIKSSLTTCNGMFTGCNNLVTLDLRGLNTENVTNMQSMFYGCSKLTALDVSNLDTSKVTTMRTMFSGCSKLTALDLSNFDTAKVTDMQQMFSNCTEILDINVSGFNTFNVTNMTGTFSFCDKLTQLNLSSFNTAKVTTMQQMFLACYKLVNLDVSSFNTENVTNMQSMFGSCEKLTSLDVSRFNTAKVTTMQGMFSYCKTLTSLDVSSFNTENVNNMQSMFGNCEKLTSLDVSSFNTAKVTTMQGMFSSCKTLTSLDVSRFNVSIVTTMQATFSGMTLLSDLNLDNIIIPVGANVNNILYNSVAITTIYLRNSDTTTYNIIDSAKPAGATIITAA